MVTNLNNSQIIKKYLSWLLLWTLVAISIYTVILVIDKMNTYSKYSKLDTQTKLLKEVSTVLYNTQAERGLSTKYLIFKKFNKNTLLAQRDKTDESINNLYIYINEVLVESEHGVLDLTNELNSNIQMLYMIRDEIDSFSMNADEAIEYYTHSFNNNILEIIEKISSSFYGIEITEELNYYNSIAKIREMVGILRARAFEFPKNKYTNKAFIQTWFNYQYLYSQLIKSSYVNLKELTALNMKFDRALYSILEQKHLSLNKNSWWSLSSEYLNKIYSIENIVIDNIIDKVHNTREDIWEKVIILIVVNILLLIVSVVYALLIMRRILNISQEIEDEHNRVNKIFNSQKSIVVTTDGVKVISVNSAFFDNFNFKDLDDFLSKHNCICDLFIDKPNVKHLMPDMDGVRWVNYVLMHQDENHEAYIIDKDGKEHVYEVQVNTEHGDFAVVVFTDITQLKYQEDLLREQSRMASMGELIGMIAHQWRQPLTAMSALVGKVKLRHQLKQLDDDMLNNSIKKHKELVTYMDRTITDFLNFYKPSNEITEINTTDMLMQPYKLLKNVYDRYHIDFQLNDSVKGILTLDINKFEQVLMNIYKNASDEMVEKNIKNGYLNVNCYEKDNSIIIEIVDNAGGIPEDIITNIFDPYFSTKSKNGTGLGLYMSKIIIEDQLDGKLIAFNQDNGAIFQITLPNKNIKQLKE